MNGWLLGVRIWELGAASRAVGVRLSKFNFVSCSLRWELDFHLGVRSCTLEVWVGFNSRHWAGHDGFHDLA